MYATIADAAAEQLAPAAQAAKARLHGNEHPGSQEEQQQKDQSEQILHRLKEQLAELGGGGLSKLAAAISSCSQAAEEAAGLLQGGGVFDTSVLALGKLLAQVQDEHGRLGTKVEAMRKGIYALESAGGEYFPFCTWWPFIDGNTHLPLQNVMVFLNRQGVLQGACIDLGTQMRCVIQ